MNELVVSVKVDREERPDVDAIYMEAVQAMTGQGGWPMTVFLMPDGRPFFGGTYFPKTARGNMLSFTDLLRRIDDVWRTRRDDLVSQADDLTESIRRGGQLPTRDDIPGPDVLDGTYASLAGQFDPAWGGFGQAPKFPQTMSLEFLLRAHAHNGSPETLAMVTTSLDAMASGGIYDHVGGAFARYSVDGQWLVPHFEKMLYDQALLARVYLHAWQVTGEARYRQVLDETIEYVMRDLRHRGGGFFSAEDADSLDPDGHPEEGRFYTWTLAEIEETVGPLVDVAAEWWGVTEGGNFEGRSILHRPVRGDLIRPADVERARRELFDEREGRPRPGLDDKVLTEWNGLMLATLAEAAHATGNHGWLVDAVADGGVPARAPPPRGREVAALVAGRRRRERSRRRARRPGPAPGLRGRLRRPARRLHPAGRGHRRGALGRRGPTGGRRPGRPVLGRRARRRVHHRPRRRDPRDPAEGPDGQRHPVGQQPGGGRAAPARRPHR